MIHKALDLITAGWAVFPCKDKRPLTTHGLKDASADPEQVRQWWVKWPGAQIGLPTGKNIGAFVLDVDLPDGPASLAALEAEHGPLPRTRTAKTASGGEHRYFRLPDGQEIRNSASKLAPGLDVRGEGGYVIAPPTPGYSWNSEGAPLADAPEWLLSLILTPAKPPMPVLKVNSPAAGSGTTKYGATALESECGKVALAPQGSRNHILNTAAFNVGQLVSGGEIDRSAAEAELLRAALRAGLSEVEAGKTLASGLTAGEQKPRHGNPTSPLRLREMARQDSGTRRAFQLLPASEMLAEPRPTDWLLRGYLEAETLACLFGESGTMKSFLALDMGLCIASGLPWHGRDVPLAGPVVYVAGEGFRGLSRRIKAWLVAHHLTGEGLPLHVASEAVQFLDPASLETATSAIAALAERPRLIIVDTLARCFGGNENDAQDMSAFVAALDRLRARFGCAVLVVHHSGKSDKERSRGSSAWRAALDMEFRLDVRDKVRVLICTKTKDHDAPPDMAFWPANGPTGWTEPETGEPIMSVVLKEADMPATNRKPLTGAKRIATEALKACNESGGGALVEDWRAEAYRRGVSSGGQEAKRKAFTRAVSELLDLGLVEVQDDRYWLRTEPDKTRTSPILSGDNKPDGHGHTPLGVSGCPVVRSGAGV